VSGAPAHVPHEDTQPYSIVEIAAVSQPPLAANHLAQGQPLEQATTVAIRSFATAVASGGPAVQWLLIVGLYIGGIVHVLGDGTVRERSEKTAASVDSVERRLERIEDLAGWLAQCELARQNGQPPPPFTFALR
jgi:hypothetical protein